MLVSEIMLQQTQVDRVKSYYKNFLAAFPTLSFLAHASDAAVLKTWSGLGYNRRALNLKKAAQELAGKPFPQTMEELVKLPGIGPYTAGAVLAFAFNRKVVFADVNIKRVIMRYFGVKEKDVRTLLEHSLLVQFVQTADAHDLYSALMDLGALVCINKPKCVICPLQASCNAYPQILTQPQKQKKTARFIGSNRWWRGQILKTLVAGKKTEQGLYQCITLHGVKNKKQFQLALLELQEEVIVKRNTTTYEV